MLKFIEKLTNKVHLYELGYACTAKDQAGILVLVNTREARHSKGRPHAHLEAMNAQDIACFFITAEIPQKKEDLRFVKGTFKGQIPAKFKDDLVEWANKIKKNYGMKGWDFLKDEWERLRPSGVSPSPYPKIVNLEEVG